MERYGVFKMFANGSRAWVGSADDLNEAKAKMLDAARRTGKEYLVYDLVLEQAVTSSMEYGRVTGSAAK
jgi:hypothetical protein